MKNEHGPMFLVLFIVAFFFIGISYVVHAGILQAHDIAIVGFVAFGAVIILFAAAVLYQIGTGSIPLAGIIAEPQDGAQHEDKPKASLSRFQFLIFTFVVAGLFLMLSIEAGRMVDIPTNVLVLIGLSGTGFLAGKSISNADTAAKNEQGKEGQGKEGEEKPEEEKAK